MLFLFNEIRNWFESSTFGLSLLDLVTRNIFYKKYIYYLFRKKVELNQINKKYGFTIEVTSFCNAKCTFCPNSKMKRHKEIMSMKVFLKTIERIKLEGIDPTYFNLGPNGEPLIDKQLFKKIRILYKNFPKVNIFFPTNLSLATPKLQVKLVNSKLDNICVSLNANNAKDYKSIMNLDFKTTTRNLNNLIKLRNKSKSKLKIYLKLAANPVNKRTINSFINKWKDKVDGIGVSWIHSWAGSMANGNGSNRQIPRYPCRTLFDQINIQTNGNIPLCCVDMEGDIIGGNVMNNKILSSINSLKIKRIKELHATGKIERINKCSQCRFCERGLYWLVK